MSCVFVKWSMTGADDPFSPVATDQETMLNGLWAGIEGNGPEAASDVAEIYWRNPNTWDSYFGLDDDEGSCRVIIHEPEAIAGTYDVWLERVVKATATKVKS